MARFPGMVHGVVVQITIVASLMTARFVFTTLKRTQMVVDV